MEINNPCKRRIKNDFIISFLTDDMNFISFLEFSELCM